MKKFVLAIIIGVLLIVGIYYRKENKNIYFDDENITSVLSYTFAVNNMENIDDILGKEKYIYSTDENCKYIAIVTFDNNMGFLTQYKVNVGEAVDISVEKGKNFIISLPRNSTITYDWNVSTTLVKTKLYDSTIIQFPDSSKGESAVYDRRNLYFKALASGNEQLDLKYETTLSNDTYIADDEIKINVQVNNQET